MQRNQCSGHATRLFALLFTGMLCAATAAASMISAVAPTPVYGSGVVVFSSVSTPAPGESNPSTFDNTIAITEIITAFDPINGFTIGMNLAPLPGNPATGYLVTKTVYNLTGFDWSGFTIAVGCDPPGGVPGTVTCPAIATPLQIDYGVAPTSSGGGTITNSGPTFFTFSGLNVGNPGPITFTFHLDAVGVPNGPSWSMHQYPVATPEPTTFALTGAGLLGLGLLKLRRSKEARQ